MMNHVPTLVSGAKLRIVFAHEKNKYDLGRRLEKDDFCNFLIF